jgi:asparagine synthase (glutamine-hydrolysing)
MCGIAGIITETCIAEPDKQIREIQAMTGALAHRGPDGEGFWKDESNQVYFGHRRLSVIDVSPAAAQPMQYGNRFTIIYNGEIYNFKELRESLLAQGYRFDTASDTEVILAAYQEYGASCVEQFDGMFAFAIWDAEKAELFLARDRMGEKPLFFTWQEGRFLFASEMKALWAVGVPKNPDPHQVLLYLGAGVTGIPLHPEQSFYQDIVQLPPAHRALLKIGNGIWGQLETERYWDLHSTRPVPPVRCHRTGGFRALLKESIRKRLRSDVPVGSSLSGGLDSSSIACLVKELGAENWTGFSAVFPGFEKDESGLIKELTSQLGIRSVTCTPTVEDLLSNLDRMLYHQEMPVESASALVQFQVMELAASEGVTVLLDGQGADELLGGYDSYIHWFLQELWRTGPRSDFKKELEAFTAHGWKGGWGWKNRFAAWFPQVAQEQLIKKQVAAVERIPFVDAAYLEAGFRKEQLYKPLVTSLQDILYFDLTMGRLPELLRYADRNSMAFGREIRLPYLQHNVMELAAGLPSRQKMQNGYTKWVLRDAMKEQLPASIVWQKRKIGYEPPQATWMQDARVKQKIFAGRELLVDRGIFQKRYLDRPIGDTGTNQVYDWRVLVLGTLFAT